MSAKQGGSFATLLLAIPLSAIPLMAIFGVPEFTHLSAATEQEIPDIVREPTLSFSPDDPAAATSDSHRQRAADLLTRTVPDRGHAGGVSEVSNRNRESAPVGSRTDVDATSFSRDRSGSEPVPRPMQTAAVDLLKQDAITEVPVAAPASTSSGMTWREATRKLDDVGISNYRLERGQSPDQFLFVCLFSPGGDARIIQRFEAEATEPLEAVEDVLAQVDTWLQHRYADSRRWLP